LSYCYNHPNQIAVAVCYRCRKLICRLCKREYNGKVYCDTCLQEILDSQGAIAEKPSIDKSRPLVPIRGPESSSSMSTPRRFCYIHKDRPATSICSVCGKLICAECRVYQGDKIYCTNCSPVPPEKPEEQKGIVGRILAKFR
jgi:hypothetical protein